MLWFYLLPCALIEVCLLIGRMLSDEVGYENNRNLRPEYDDYMSPKAGFVI